MADSGARDASRRQVLAVQIVVSVGAIVALLAHVLLPDFDLDMVAVALLGLAVVPWLGVLVESLEFGGTKVRYREIRKQVEQVQERLEHTRDSLTTLDDRVGKVESFVFSGSATPEQRDTLSLALSAYRTYLQELGVEPGPVMRIHVDRHESPMAAYPDAARGRFVIGMAFADQPDALLHEYTHHLLATMAPAPREQWERGIAGVESGLAYYLPSSARDHHIHANMYDLSAPPRPGVFAPGQTHRDGLHWASAFWELRQLDGRERFDRSLISAWRTVWASSEPSGTDFVDAVRASGSVPGGAIEAALRRHQVHVSG